MESRIRILKELRARRRREAPRGRKEKRETGIQRQILQRLELLPYVKLERNNRGQKGHVRFGLGDGAADLIGCVGPTGRFFGLEIKRPGEKPDPHQVAWAESVRRLGGYVGTASSVEEALKCVEEARNGNHR